jgi:hypothetical protein
VKKEIQSILRERLQFPENSNIQQRGIADKIEDACNRILSEHFTTTPARSRRSIEDITVNGSYVDHKTSDESLDFKMPNLISIDRLISLDKELLYNFVVYNSQKKTITKVFVLGVHELNWDHLSIQNLGVGQLQITNMRDFILNPRTVYTREEWIDRLKMEAIKFYDKLIEKTQKRRQKWQYCMPIQ